MIKKTLILLTVIACMTVATANAGWLYLVPDYNWFGYRDRNGVLHVWRTGKGSLQLSLPFSVSREPCAENLLLRSSIKGERCWLWQGRRTRGAYGRIKIKGQDLAIHRLIWEENYGPIPAGFEIHHVCENRLCVRPTHLFSLRH